MRFTQDEQTMGEERLVLEQQLEQRQEGRQHQGGGQRAYPPENNRIQVSSTKQKGPKWKFISKWHRIS